MSLIDRVKVVEEMFTDLLSVTVKLSDSSDQYLKYKVDCC